MDAKDSGLKKDDDLIRVVLSAVEENWLKQAPQPTLDKEKALKEESSIADVDESEKDTSCSEATDYFKEKIKAQGSGTGNVGDEAERLVDSNGDDLPYLPTTLPQEKSGTVTITPTNKRLSECKLTSVDRPRSVSPRKPGNFEEFIKNGKQKSSERMQVKLPSQDVKPSIQAKQQTTWEAFTSQGLEDPRQTREKMMKNRQQTVDIGVFQADKKKTGNDATSPTTPTGWVNCEEIPSPKKPVRRYDSDEDESSSSRTSSFKHQSSSIDSSSSSSSSASKGSNISKRSSVSASSARSSTSSKSSSYSSSRSSIQSKSSSSSVASGKTRPSAIALRMIFGTWRSYFIS